MNDPTVEQIEEARRLIENTYRADRSMPELTLDERRLIDRVLPAFLAQYRAEQVAALGVADGEVEYAVRADNSPEWPPTLTSTRGEALRIAHDVDYAIAVQRTVQYGPWVEVTNEGGEGA